MSGNESSAAHWCKAVIEQTVPAPISLSVPPPPTPPAMKQNLPKVGAATAPAAPAAAQLNPQYLQLYQQMYSTQPAVDSNRTYASVVAQQNAAATAAGLSRSISAPWGATYGAPIVQTSYTAAPTAVPAPVPPPSLAYALQQQAKKPNKSRFTAPPITVGVPQLSAVRAAPTAPVAPPPPPQQSGQPESLREFVKRAFASCQSGAQREYVTGVLKARIAKVTGEGRLHSHNWDLEPVPPFDPLNIGPPPVIESKPVITVSRSVMSGTSGLNGLSGYTGSQPVSDGNKGDKKRKSRFGEEDNSLSVNTALKSTVFAGVEKLNTPQEVRMREQRANRFQADEQANNSSSSASFTFTQNNNAINKKKRKVANSNAGKIAALMAANNNSDSGADFDLDNLKIVGTCQKLEKDYLRLTSAPHANIVRPEPVLRKAIQLIKKKWAAEEVDYVYMCSQLKSLRQDLTVQHIQNDFTVHVYETHARVALESDDMNEYNQCQTQLKQLYAAGLKGSEMEFTAYRILYYVYLLGNKKYTGGSSDLAHLMSSLSPEAYKNEAVAHALQIRQALQLDNYHRFFKLYRNTPNMGSYILDLMVDNWRVLALQKMCRGYKPDVGVDFVLEELAFPDRTLGLDFLRKVGCVVVGNEVGTALWNTKDSVVDLSALLSDSKLLL